MNRILVGCIWLVWSSCMLLGLLISLEDTFYTQKPKASMHSSQNEINVELDSTTGEIKLSKVNKPLRLYQKIELAMSLGRSPKRADESAWLLLIFTLASQVLILHNVQRPALRWLFFGLLIVVGTLWTWYQATYWLSSMGSTFMSKLLGGPIDFMGVPAIAFCFLAPRRVPPMTPFWLIIAAVVQGALYFPWMYVWGFTQLALGWLWI